MTRYRLTVWIQMVVLAAIFCVLFYSIKIKHFRNDKLDRLARIADGRLISKSKTRFFRYYTYEFNVDGQTYRHTNLISAKNYDDFKPGDVLDIEYLPKEIDKTRPKDAYWNPNPLFYTLFGIFLICVLSVVYGIRERRRQKIKWAIK